MTEVQHIRSNIRLSGREIGERFIRAVEVMEKSYSPGPSKGASAWVQFPYTQADKNGWGTERLEAERRSFWNSLNNSPKPWEISEAEKTLDWLRFVSDESERQCLTGWARCMALGEVFKDLCKEMSIHPETGRAGKSGRSFEFCSHSTVRRCCITILTRMRCCLIPLIWAIKAPRWPTTR